MFLNVQFYPNVCLIIFHLSSVLQQYAYSCSSCFNHYVQDAITSTMSATISSCCCLFALLLVKYYIGNVFYLATSLCYGVVLSHSWVSLICMARDTEWSHLILLLSAFLGHSIKSYRIAHCCLCNDSNKFKKQSPSLKVNFEFQEFPGEIALCFNKH